MSPGNEPKRAWSRVRGACRVLVGAALLLAATPPAGERDRVRWQGTMRNIAVHVPATGSAELPLLLVLGQPGRSARYSLNSWRETADREGFLLAAIASEQPEAWRTPQDGPGFLRAVVQHLKARHQVDTRRVYLFGAGVGGGFALSMAALQPEYFAAVASFGGQPRLDVLHLQPFDRPLPVRVYFSKRMPQFEADVLRASAATLRELGGAVEVQRLDVGPNFERTGRKVAGRIWSSLASHALSEPARYRSSRFYG